MTSEYEAKRLRRIAENRQKLQELNISTVATNASSMTKQKKRKHQEVAMEPTRKSPRQDKKQKIENKNRKLEKRKKDEAKERKRLQKLEKERRKLEKRKKDEAKERKKLQRLEKERRKLKKEEKLEKKLKKELKAKKKELKAMKKEDEKQESGKVDKNENLDQETKEQPKILDWRMRRKLQAREERRLATLKKREEQKALRLKENLKLRKIKVKERKLRKKQKEKERLAIIVQKELELQRRMEEGELMREEDRLARQVAKQIVKDDKNKKQQERKAMVNGLMEEIVTEEQKLVRQKEDELRKVICPVQKIDLPLVYISDPIDSYKTKPMVLSLFLNVDVNLFHAFSLGKQFLPPGKKSVMQGLCRGGFTTTFQDHVDIHVWKNAMTLFVSGTTGLFYEYMFEEATHHEKQHVFFRWTRTQAVTPHILWRMCQVQKGEEFLHLNQSYYDAPMPTQKPEPLLLFVQYPKGPYIYCGRLGYLGHQVDPLELSFQLLDINALNWRRIHTLLTSC